MGEGERKLDIKLLDTVAILRAIAREAIEWELDPATGLEVPQEVEGVGPSKLRVVAHYTASELEERVKDQQRARREWLDRYPTFDESLKQAVY